MAPKDRWLGRVSAGATLVALAGVVTLMFLPLHTSERRKLLKPAPLAAAPPVAQGPARETPQASSAPPQSAQVPAKDESGPVKPADDVFTEAEVAAALRECVRLLAPVVADVELEVPIKHGQCGSPAPIYLRSIGTTAKVDFSPAPMMNCRLAAGFARWVETVLQPAAREVLGSRITRIVGASSYACRHVYSNPQLAMSEHATANAVDVAAFVTADGRSISVKKGWGPTERDIAEARKKSAEKLAEAKKQEKGAKAAADDSKPSAEATEAPDAKESQHVQKAGFKADAPPHAAMVTATASPTAAKTTETAFLKRLHKGACGVFKTVLGPEANDAHRDHFHFDMKERKGHGICH